MSVADAFQLDGLFWMVLLVALLEGVHVARIQKSVRSAKLSTSVPAGALEALMLAMCAATTSPHAFVALGALRLGVSRWREGNFALRRTLELALVAVAMSAAVWAADATTFSGIGASALAIGPTWRMIILAVLSSACVLAILPTRLADEAKTTLAAPYVLVAFARIGVPLEAAEPRLALAAPIVGAILAAVCALWLLSAGMRANHFEHSSLASELLMCERGVLLAFVWMGLASGERLAGVGAFVEWWAAALALLALEASLRVRPLPKPMAFFALAMAVGLPGTTGFVADDLLAHGLLELRPLLAAVFVGVGAINAAALYLALVNIIVDEGQGQRTDARPTAMMLAPAAITLVIGLFPRPFVSTATAAREAVAPGEAAAAEQLAHGSADASPEAPSERE